MYLFVVFLLFCSSPSQVGNSTWSSVQRGGAYFHAGTIQNKKNQTFVSDLRVMVSATPQNGFQPLAVYARRARMPLLSRLPVNTSVVDSWGMLGTNLSVRNVDTGDWETDTSRLLLMDMKDFNKLGIAIDELIDAYVQTCLATIAIDRMACRLTKKNGVFGQKKNKNNNNNSTETEWNRAEGAASYTHTLCN